MNGGVFGYCALGSHTEDLVLHYRDYDLSLSIVWAEAGEWPFPFEAVTYPESRVHQQSGQRPPDFRILF